MKMTNSDFLCACANINLAVNLLLDDDPMEAYFIGCVLCHKYNMTKDCPYYVVREHCYRVVENLYTWNCYAHCTRGTDMRWTKLTTNDDHDENRVAKLVTYIQLYRLLMLMQKGLI